MWDNVYDPVGKQDGVLPLWAVNATAMIRKTKKILNAVSDCFLPVWAKCSYASYAILLDGPMGLHEYYCQCIKQPGFPTFYWKNLEKMRSRPGKTWKKIMEFLQKNNKKIMEKNYMKTWKFFFIKGKKVVSKL